MESAWQESEPHKIPCHNSCVSPPMPNPDGVVAQYEEQLVGDVTHNEAEHDDVHHTNQVVLHLNHVLTCGACSLVHQRFLRLLSLGVFPCKSTALRGISSTTVGQEDSLYFFWLRLLTTICFCSFNPTFA